MLILIAVIFAVYDDFILAVTGFLAGVIFLFSFEGIRIDTGSGRMQKFYKILWFRFGKWIPLPVVQYVTINRYNIRGSQSGITGGGGSGAGVYKAYKINLVIEGKNQYITLMRGKKEQMIEESIKIGKLLNCRVLDYTSHEKQWLL